jgi:phage gp46-like protein
MPDISTIWNVSEGRGDWQMSGRDLASGNDLVTTIVISLFTDRQAQPDDALPDTSGDPRGWWGDLDATVPIGSRLWLLERAKQTNETLQRANDYVKEALQWLIDDGVVAAFDILTEWTRPGMLGVKVTAHRPDGTKIPLQYDWAWNGLN